MASSILSLLRFARANTLSKMIAAALFAGALQSSGAKALPTCTGASPGPSGLQLSDAKDSPFYALLLSRLGAPLACHITDDEAGREIVLTFRSGGLMTFSANEETETSSQDVVIPIGKSPLRVSDGIGRLREVEQWAAPPKGCGINWTKFIASANLGKSDISAAGTFCSCQVRLQISNGGILDLAFGMAC